MGFFSDVWDWFTGDSLTANLAKTAALGYTTRLLNDTSDESDNLTSAGALGVVEDKGVRLQLSADTENKLPVLYGENYLGGYLTDAEISPDYRTMTYCLSIAELTGNHLDGSPTSYTFNHVYLNNNRVIFKADGITVDRVIDSNGNEDVSYDGLIKIYFYADVPLQPDGFTGTTPPSYDVMPGWTQLTHPMTGVMYAIVQVTYSRDKGVTGLPNCTWHVTSDLTYPGDVLHDYMTNKVYGGGIPETEIDNSLQELNDYGIAGFTYTDPLGTIQTGPIAINGLVDTKKTVLNNMQDLVKCVSSWISYDIHAGQWSVVINKPGTSIASLDDSNIIGDINVGGTSLTSLYNKSDVKYQNTDIKDKTDFVKITLPPSEWYQNEPESSQQISLPYTNKQATAIKVGLLALKQARLDKSITFTTDYSYINLKAGQIIDITSTELGYTNKLFRIITTSEVDGPEGDIQIQFTCLEYDDTLYDYNISEFLIETDDGIFNFGSIGKPDVPIITNNYKDVSPHLLIDGKVPSGVVDRMEYWVTRDTHLGNDENRTYELIGIIEQDKPYFENQVLQYKYNTTILSDVYVKVRGVNSVTTGPFSDPSGLIQYVPQQVADTVSDVPVDMGDGILGQLGLLSLLKLIDYLMRDDQDPAGTGGIWERIFKIFEDETGVDLPQEAKDGNLGGIPTGMKINDLIDVNTTPSPGDVLTYNGSLWVADDSCCSGSTPGFVDKQCDLTITDWSPQGNPCEVPYTGSMRFVFSEVPEYTSLQKNTGNIELYTIDGYLVESIPVSNCTIESTAIEGEVAPSKNTLVVPFADREKFTEYYVLMDKGVVIHCAGCKSKEICSPEQIRFKTGEFECPDTAPPSSDSLYVTDVSFYPNNEIPNCTEAETYIQPTVTFSQPVLHYSGNASLLSANGTPVDEFNGGCKFNYGTTDEKTLKLPPVQITNGQKYKLSIPPGFAIAKSSLLDPPVTDACGVEHSVSQDPLLSTEKVQEFDAPTIPPLTPSNQREAGNSPSSYQKQTNGFIDLDMGRSVTTTGGTGQATVRKSDGTIIADVTPASGTVTTVPSEINLIYTYPFNPWEPEYGDDLCNGLELGFDKRIKAGTGMFYLYEDGILIDQWDVQDANDSSIPTGRISIGGENDESGSVTPTPPVTGDGDGYWDGEQYRNAGESTWQGYKKWKPAEPYMVYLQPKSKLNANKTYYVLADSGSLITSCEDIWNGISSSSEFTFTTSYEPIQTTETSPRSGDKATISNGIELTVKGDVKPGDTGQVHLYKADGTLVRSYNPCDPEVEIIN